MIFASAFDVVFTCVSGNITLSHHWFVTLCKWIFEDAIVVPNSQYLNGVSGLALVKQ